MPEVEKADAPSTPDLLTAGRAAARIRSYHHRGTISSGRSQRTVTLLLAAWIDGTAILAADRRVQIGPLGGPLSNAEGDKLFPVGNCAVASFGRNPFGVDVPKAIRQLSNSPRSAEAIARDLHEESLRWILSGILKLVVVGVEESGPELWEAISMQRQDFPVGRIRSWGPVELTVPILDHPDHICDAMSQVFRQVAQQSDSVGPPFEAAILRRGVSPVVVSL